ncbi:STAS domain-containing protein [Sphingomonas yunnanensis]|uniref:STAS domain-containing protein n=1 Tax=Sphingomonas yunnanensis TaxID=310400 RepID=UPI001CA675F6|nr:STAS domain-containing protein [Sphingomonas yunnanensis]MBY9063085.1 STAS domain-containing protein [Sphingomonas yunnanensis]
MTTTIVAERDVSLASVDRLAAALRESLARGALTRLDLSAVAAPDLALLQLVEAARHQATRDGTDLALSAPAGATLADALARSGFTAGFDADDHVFWFHGELPR